MRGNSDAKTWRSGINLGACAALEGAFDLVWSGVFLRRCDVDLQGFFKQGPLLGAELFVLHAKPGTTQLSYLKTFGQ